MLWLEDKYSILFYSNLKTGLHIYLYRGQALTPKSLLTKTGLHASVQRSLLSKFELRQRVGCFDFFYMNQRVDKRSFKKMYRRALWCITSLLEENHTV
jgi:hypothetical protein